MQCDRVNHTYDTLRYALVNTLIESGGGQATDDQNATDGETEVRVLDFARGYKLGHLLAAVK